MPTLHTTKNNAPFTIQYFVGDILIYLINSSKNKICKTNTPSNNQKVTLWISFHKSSFQVDSQNLSLRLRNAHSENIYFSNSALKNNCNSSFDWRHSTFSFLEKRYTKVVVSREKLQPN
jgi:hypothetical protein